MPKSGPLVTGARVTAMFVAASWAYQFTVSSRLLATTRSFCEVGRSSADGGGQNVVGEDRWDGRGIGVRDRGGIAGERFDGAVAPVDGPGGGGAAAGSTQVERVKFARRRPRPPRWW